MRGLKRLRSAARIAAGHAFVQNLRPGHYGLAADVSPPLRLAAAFSELALAVTCAPQNPTLVRGCSTQQTRPSRPRRTPHSQ